MPCCSLPACGHEVRYEQRHAPALPLEAVHQRPAPRGERAGDELGRGGEVRAYVLARLDIAAEQAQKKHHKRFFNLKALLYPLKALLYNLKAPCNHFHQSKHA